MQLGNEEIIEVCASGGHRLEPAMLALGAMGFFGDAHESRDIPLIAANLHLLHAAPRRQPPADSLSWKLRKESGLDLCARLIESGALEFEVGQPFAAYVAHLVCG